MKTGLKSFVRAISPFTKAKSTEGQPPSKTEVNEFFWDLSKVDMVAMLSSFYATYNPERVRSVHEILHQYEGEEVLMLQQLCERYNLSEPDIQAFLDNALLGRKDKDKFGNWMLKKKSEGSVSFTDLDSKDAVSTASAQDTKDNRPRSGYSGFVWDLSAIDLSKALKLLYRKHNPQKTPNVSSLDNKTENEKILLLQQLCKRHNLTQTDMQYFLDKARNKDDSSYQTKEGLISKARYGSKGRPSGVASAAASVDGGSQTSKSDSLRKSVGGSEIAASLFSSFQRQPSRSIAEDEDAANSVDGSGKSEGKIVVGGQQRQASLQFWQSAFPLSSMTSSPPPPPPPPAVFNASPSSSKQPLPGRPAVPATLSTAHHQSTSPGSVASSVTSSVTAGSRFGPVGDTRSNSRYAPSPTPSMTSLVKASAAAHRQAEAAQTSVGSRDAIYSEYDDRREEASEVVTSASVGRLSTADRSKSRTANPAPDNTSTAGSRSAEGARAAELLDLQRELSEARLQVVGAKKENQALAKALQSSKQRQTDAESTVSELSNHQAHLEQVPELLTEISKLKGLLQQQEERESALKRQYGQLKEQVHGLQEQVVAAERQCEDARGDARDVLCLVDIMSASPAGIKSVLEAYLKQLGEATGSVPVKFGIGTDGRQIPISERIAMALQIKREQQLQSESILKEKLSREVGGSEAPAKSRGSNSSSGRAVERQQDNYQKFKSDISQQQNKNKRDKGEILLGDKDVSDGARSEAGDDAGARRGEGAEEFLDYASPDAARKSSSRSASRSKKTSEEKSAVVLGDAESQERNSTVTDWIECLDPRSKRKYYYSAILKKSTWTKPTAYSNSGNSRAALGSSALPSMGVTMPSRYNSPNLSMHMTGRQPQNALSAPNERMTADELGNSDSTDPLSLSVPHRSGQASSLRSASPFSTASFGTGAGVSSAQSDYANVFSSSSRKESSEVAAVQSSFKSSNGAYNSRSSSPALTKTSLRSNSPSIRAAAQQSPARGGVELDWVTAVDPNSNRKYWYNRKTKVSTWRQPAELII